MQPKVLGEFYEKVFDRKPDWADGGWYSWKIGDCALSVGEHSEMGGKAKDPGRVMFNLETDDVKGEFERMSKVEGIKVIKEPYTMEGEGMENAWIATLADPDGNYFQLVTPWEDMK